MNVVDEFRVGQIVWYRDSCTLGDFEVGTYWAGMDDGSWEIYPVTSDDSAIDLADTHAAVIEAAKAMSWSLIPRLGPVTLTSEELSCLNRLMWAVAMLNREEARNAAVS